MAPYETKSPSKWLSIGGSALLLTGVGLELRHLANEPAPSGYQHPTAIEKSVEEMQIPCGEPTLYTVDYGDTFSELALEHFSGMSYQEVADKNLIDNNSAIAEGRSEIDIHAGDQLTIQNSPDCSPDK